MPVWGGNRREENAFQNSINFIKEIQKFYEENLLKHIRLQIVSKIWVFLKLSVVKVNANKFTSSE